MTDNHTDGASATEAAPAAPLLRVLKGNPSDSEVAALTLLFASLSASSSTEEKNRVRNDWGRYDEAFHGVSSFSPRSFLNSRF